MRVPLGSRHVALLVLTLTLIASALMIVPGAGTVLATAPGEGVQHPRTTRQHATGTLGFVGNRDGRPIARPAGVPATARPAAIARAFVHRYANRLGLSGPGSRVRVTRTGPAPAGGRSVRLQQTFRGVPVMAGELVVNLDADGNLRSMNAETSPDIAADLDTSPGVTFEEAAATAVRETAAATGLDGADLTPADPELVIYDPRLLDTPGAQFPALTWRVEVTSPTHPDVRRLVLVDAQRGGVRFQLDLIAEAKNRSVCDSNNTNSNYPCVSPARVEGGGPHAVADVNQAYDYGGDTYDFYKDQLSRDSIDGKGMQLRSTVRYCSPSASCPYANAFWNGSQMTYGQGFTNSLDVVAHEMTHGLTETTSNLYYYAQSGAINESMSDVFGKFVQLSVQSPAPADRWRLGVGLPGFPSGLRDMKDPTAFGDPDKMTSPNYYGGVNDRFGVHTNSGVGNKAGYLIVDGGSFNGQTVTGIGIPKAAKIYYEVERNFLISGSDYLDLANGLRQACASLTGKNGITKANCTQVGKAVKAVEMEKSPTNAPVKRAPVCAKGLLPGNLFFDNFEKNANAWQVTGSPLSAWAYRSPTIRYTRSGTGSIWGYPEYAVTDSREEMKSPVKLPANAYFRFEHAFEFIAPSPPSTLANDGGMLEYSVNGGTTWVDAGPLFTDGTGYNRTISAPTNPLNGRKVFGYFSFGFGSSRLDLKSLKGKDVRFRFRLAGDGVAQGGYGAWGWHIDDVRIYTCAKAPDTKITKAVVKGKTVTLTLTGSGGEGKLKFECSVDGGKWKTCKSGGQIKNLKAGKRTIAVRSKDSRGRLDPTPATKKVTIK